MLLSGRSHTELLSSHEVMAIATHLRANIPQLKLRFDAANITRESLVALVKGSKVVRMRRSSSDLQVSSRTPNPEDILFKRGRPATSFLLILSGKVGVLAGNESFFSEVCPWSHIGVEAVCIAGTGDETYVPDFTAFVLTEELRCLWVTQIDVQQLLSSDAKDLSLAQTRRPVRRKSESMSALIGDQASSTQVRLSAVDSCLLIPVTLVLPPLLPYLPLQNPLHETTPVSAPSRLPLGFFSSPYAPLDEADPHPSPPSLL
jgi:CRP-like cAMP-binding protein